METFNILITSPSLIEQNNVSGISSVVRNIIAFPSETINYFHFKLGRRFRRNGLLWIFDQIFIVPLFIYNVKKYNIQAVHLNTGFEKLSLYRDFSIFLISKYLLSKKIVFHIHGGYYLMNPPSKHNFLHLLIKILLEKSDAVIVLSDLEKQFLKANYVFNNCYVLPNAVSDPELKNSQKEFSGPLRFCFLGRIVKSKGVYIIIEALKLMDQYFRDFSFHIYGTGPELVSILESLKKIPGLNYEYHGVVSGQEKWDALQNSHIFLLPSLYGEGLPMAMLEAMNVKCIPVVTNDASIESVVKNEYNGFIVKKGDADGLSAILKFILKHRDILAALGNEAHNTISEQFKMDKYAISLGNIYAVSILY